MSRFQKKLSIGEFCKVCAGGTPDTTNRNYWERGQIPWMSSGEIHKKRVKQTNGFITGEGLLNSSAKIFPRNTVLVALAGQGKTRGIVAISEIELSTNQSIAGIISDKSICLPEFLYFNLGNRYQELRSISGGSGRAGLNLSIISNLKINLPSLPEQKKISIILTEIEKLIQKNKIKLFKLDLLKNALIQNLLFKGVYSHNYKKTSIGIFPESWETASINSVCKFIKRGPSLSTNSIGKGIRYITSGNIVNNKISLEADYKFLDNFEGVDKCLIHKDDLILNCVNSEAKLASSALYKNNIKSIVGFNNYALTLDLDKCLPSFIFYWTKTSNFHNQVKSFAKSAINQVSFSKKDLESIYLPLPSLDEQFKICQAIDPIISLQEDLEMKLNKYISYKNGLANDLMSGRIIVHA